jgi:diacylglycerol O-acyltransferase
MIETEDSLPRHLSASDSVAWRIEHNPLLRSTITVVMQLDRAPDPQALRRTVEAASVAFPRLRQRVAEVPFGASTPVWVNDPNFDIDYHLRSVRVGGRRSHRDVLDLAAAIAMQAFDRDRPLWEWTVVDDLEDGTAALIIKLHHAVTDGVGGIRLMSQLFDLDRDGRERPAAVAPAGENPTAASLLREGVRDMAGRRISRARAIAGGISSLARNPRERGLSALADVASAARLVAPADGPLSPLMTARSPRLHFESLTVPMSELKTASRRAGGKLNDAFMVAVAIGLRHYHEAHGHSVSSLRVNMPVNLRTEDSSVAGNNWAPARFVVPIEAGDVDDHMRQMRDIVAAQRAEPALRFADSIAAVLDQLPTRVLTQVFTSMLTCLDFAATNVPGAPIPVYIAGSRVEVMEAFAPPSGAAMNFALLSYRDQATIAINIDPAAVPDPARLLECTRRGFEEVFAPAADLTIAGRPARRTRAKRTAPPA